MSPKSKLLTFLLCAVFGCLRLHRFYVGKTISGFLYLATFGFCGIGWFIDLILITYGYFTDSQGRPIGYTKREMKLITGMVIIDIIIDILTLPFRIIGTVFDLFL